MEKFHIGLYPIYFHNPKYFSRNVKARRGIGHKKKKKERFSFKLKKMLLSVFEVKCGVRF